MLCLSFFLDTVKSINEEANLEEQVIPSEMRCDQMRIRTQRRDALSSVCERPLGKEEAVKWGFTMYGQPDSHTLPLFHPVCLETNTEASNTPSYIYTQDICKQRR